MDACSSVLGLIKTTVELLFMLFLTTARTIYQLLRIHATTYFDIARIWTPFVGLQVCRLVLKALKLTYRSPESLIISEAVSSTRRISASYQWGGPPSSSPTLATSRLTASKMPSSHTYSELPMASSARSRQSRMGSTRNIPLPNVSITTTLTTATALPSSSGDENLLPSGSVVSLQAKQRDSIELATAKLRTKPKAPSAQAVPKSSTFNVLTNLTASISRTSLPGFRRTTSASSTAAASESSVTSRASNGPANHLQISAPQSPEYWAGRFVALHDRFRSEMLLPENMTTLIAAHAERSTLSERITPTISSMTASASSSLLLPSKIKGHRYSTFVSATNSKGQSKNSTLTDAELLDDEDNRVRRVFLHLEALCTTSEAKRSLRAWQHSYARRMKKDDVLPKDEIENDKSWVERLLGYSHEAGKRGSIANII